MNIFAWNEKNVINKINSQGDIDCSMKTILIDWLFQVMDECKFPYSYIHRAIKILDMVIELRYIKRTKLQLIACSILSIIDKYFSRESYTVETWLYLSDNNFTAEDFINMEMEILIFLEWDVFHITYYDLLCRELDKPKYNISQRNLGHLLANYLLHFNSVCSYNMNLVAQFIIRAIKFTTFNIITPEEHNMIKLIKLIKDHKNSTHPEIISFQKIKMMMLKHKKIFESIEFENIIYNLDINTSVILDLSFRLSEIQIPYKHDSSKKIMFVSYDDITKYLKLGEGSFGCVYKVKYQDQNYAMKKFISEDSSGELDKNTLREIVALKKIISDHVVDIKGITKDSNNIVYILMTLCDTNLHNWIKYIYDESKVQQFINNIIDGLYDIHENGFIHRDLKPQNILLDKDQIKICDLGISSHVDIYYDTDTKFYEMCTLWYRPPESLLGTTLNSTSIDIWSLGCIIYELLLKRPLFPGDSEIDQIFQIFRIFGTPNNTTWDGVESLPEYKSTWPKWKPSTIIEEQLKNKLSINNINILKKMLEMNPKKRITIAEIKDNWNV